MAKAYLEELVSTVTEDGLVLDGAVIRPAGEADKPPAVVWIHGFTGKFYEPFILLIGRALAGDGYTLVTGHNRGHHCGATLERIDGRPMLTGGWWERIEQSPHDVAAWIDFAAALGFRSVALLGHSLGAMKVPYYQAQRQDPRVGGVIVASPPLAAGRLSPETISRAAALVAEGRGQDLLPWGSLGGFSTTSAETFLSWARTLPAIYREGAPDPAIARIHCPIFALYGAEEETVGTAADLDTIRRTARAAARVETRLFEGAMTEGAGAATGGSRPTPRGQRAASEGQRPVPSSQGTTAGHERPVGRQGCALLSQQAQSCQAEGQHAGRQHARQGSCFHRRTPFPLIAHQLRQLALL